VTTEEKGQVRQPREREAVGIKLQIQDKKEGQRERGREEKGHAKQGRRSLVGGYGEVNFEVGEKPNEMEKRKKENWQTVGWEKIGHVLGTARRTDGKGDVE